MTDGQLRQIFQKHLPEFHWQSVETWSTGRGVPDLNFCCGGVEGWIELKKTTGEAVGLSGEQVGWIERRIRAGGRVFVAVRRVAEAGPRRGPAVDELRLYRGEKARCLLTRQRDVAPIGTWTGGPAKWDWPVIKSLILHTKFF